MLERKRKGQELDEDIEWIRTLYTVERIKTVKLERFETEGNDYKLSIREGVFTENMTLDESLHFIYYLMEGILEDILGHLPDSTYARVVILGGEDGDNLPISTSMQKKENITAELLFWRIENIVQSNKRFFFQNGMTIHVIYTKIPEGRGRKKYTIQLRDKKSVFSM